MGRRLLTPGAAAPGGGLSLALRPAQRVWKSRLFPPGRPLGVTMERAGTAALALRTPSPLRHWLAALETTRALVGNECSTPPGDGTWALTVPLTIQSTERKTLREKEARGLSRVCALRPPRRSGAGAPPQSPLRPGSRGHPSPWWLGSGQPRLLGGLTPRQPGLPWRRCAGACARSWWPRRGEPCAAEAAGRSPSCPGGRRCAAASAPPATQGESDVSAGTEQTRSVVSA